MRKVSAIEGYATRILNKTKAMIIPVPLDLVARRLGIVLRAADLDEVSGLLVLKDDVALIVYNREQPYVRQRFTIAHEIGHFLFHKEDGESLFIDKHYITRRDSRSSSGEDPKEVESIRSSNPDAKVSLVWRYCRY